MTIPALKTVFGDIVEAVAADSSLDTWSNTYFGNDHYVYADIASDDPPTSDDKSPFVIIAMPGRSASQSSRTVSDRMAVFCCFSTETYKTVTDPDIKYPSGIDLMLDFVGLVWDAIVGAIPDRYDAAFDVDTDNMGVLPEIHAEFALTLTRGLIMGEDMIVC